MRQYRGNRVDNGDWVYGDIHWGISYKSAHIHPIPGSHRSRHVILSTVGQSTGLTDKEGVEIYEGDITMYTWAAVGVLGQCNKEAVVEWNMPLARFDGCPNGCVVIGNIHDNPELIKGD